MIELLSAIGSILLIDLVLSGDNAVVIGAAAAGLARRQRWYAIVLGGAGAIILRIVFAILATFLLRLPLLQAIGGLLLLVIAVRLLMDRRATHQLKQTESEQTLQKAQLAPGSDAPANRSFLSALLTILVADVTMSLDNVLAIGALAAGNLPLLIVGLLLSIVLVLLGSALVAELIQRLPWLLDIAALVLAWTAANMLLHDVRLGAVLEHLPWAQLAIPGAALAIVLVADILLWQRETRHASNRNGF